MPQKKLDNVIVDERLLNRNIERLDDYIGANVLINFRCQICQFIWKTSPSHVISGSCTGCPNCAGIIKFDNTIIDNKIEGRNIKRLDFFLNMKTKIKWQCIVCDYIWEATPSSVINDNHNCAKCNGTAKLNNDVVDKRLINRDIKRLGHYINATTKIDFQCTICSYIWQTTPHHVLTHKSGCPNCNSYKNESIVYNILKENNIKVERFKYLKNIIKVDRVLVLDFYLPDNQIIIEYNGEQHYKPVCFGSMTKQQAEEKFEKQKARDIYLQQMCDENNIKLIWIDGTQFINSKLIKHINNNILPVLKIDNNE